MRPQAQLLDQLPSVEVMTHPEILGTLFLEWPDEAACAAFAARLAARPGIRDATVELHGELGAGKTTFVRHLLRALGVGGRIKSPSYAVLEPYEIDGVAVSHFDFYRFDDPREWIDAGFRDVFARAGLKLIEWPEKAGALLPAPDLRLHLRITGETSRSVTVEALTRVGEALLR